MDSSHTLVKCPFHFKVSVNLLLSSTHTHTHSYITHMTVINHFYMYLSLILIPLSKKILMKLFHFIPS